MTKFNRPGTRTATESAIKTEPLASGKTYEGAPGFARDTKSELFLLAVSDFAGEDSFYETGSQRLARYDALSRELAREDPDWLVRFVKWLRAEANMRSAPIVIACNAIHERFAKKLPGFNRELTRAAILRADEPGEMLGYWFANFGRTIPNSMKRGIGDKMIELGTEFNYLKWGTSEARGFKFADILNLTHPGDRKSNRQRITGPRQHDLFGYAVKKPYQNELTIPESLSTLTRRQALMNMPIEERRSILENPDVLRQAGMTWESVAGWLQGPMDARAWEAIIPSMSYMALLRNLRNFDEAGVSDEVAQRVIDRLRDPEQVARSRQLPMRFLSAHRHAPSLRWSYALEQALGLSLRNIETVDGRTLVLVDTSGSMHRVFSKDGSLMRWDAAAIFGIAFGSRCADADVVSFSGTGYWYGGQNHNTKVFPLHQGESLLRSLERWKNGGYFIGGGTDTEGAIRRHYRNHDRVVILTDEQAHYGGGVDVTASVPRERMVYTWNLAGYKHGHAPSGTGTRHTFGGLSDKAFAMIQLIERGSKANWPF